MNRNRDSVRVDARPRGRLWVRDIRQAERRIMWAALACCLWLNGCRAVSNEQFTPPEERAKNALVAVLEQWKSGAAPAPIEGDPLVRISDTQRRDGQRLLNYSIVGAESLDVGRRFQVQLQLDNPAEQQTVQFIVVGIDPLWVFRREDYDVLAHWDMSGMDMSQADTKASPTAKSP